LVLWLQEGLRGESEVEGLVVHLVSMTDWKDPEEQAEDKQQSTNVLPQVYASHDCLDVSDFQMIDNQRGKRVLAGNGDPDSPQPLSA
jgi:hypothetical protein